MNVTPISSADDMDAENANSDSFFSLSEAANLLTQGMWGGVHRAAPVRSIKQLEQKLSVGFGPWQEQAQRRIRIAAVTGELAIYVLDGSKIAAKERDLSLYSGGKPAPEPVSPSVLKRMITSRGGLPDRPARTSVQMTDGNLRLLRLLTNGVLVVRKTDFNSWYRSERAKGKWPSQSSRLQRSTGRPRKRSPAIKNAIERLVRDQAWSAKDGIPALRRLLVQNGRVGVPNVSTLRHTVVELFVETGDLAFRRLRRPRSAQLPSNRAKIHPAE